MNQRNVRPVEGLQYLKNRFRHERISWYDGHEVRIEIHFPFDEICYGFRVAYLNDTEKFQDTLNFDGNYTGVWSHNSN